MKIIFAFIILFSLGASAADLPVSQMPSSSLAASAPKMDSENLLIIRDAGFGLGIGALAGLGFVAMSPGGFSNQHPSMQSGALVTGLFVGLTGGILTGLWQVKHNRLLKLQVNPGDFKTQPTSLNTTLTF